MFTSLVVKVFCRMLLKNYHFHSVVNTECGKLIIETTSFACFRFMRFPFVNTELLFPLVNLTFVTSFWNIQVNWNLLDDAFDVDDRMPSNHPKFHRKQPPFHCGHV